MRCPFRSTFPVASKPEIPRLVSTFSKVVFPAPLDQNRSWKFIGGYAYKMKFSLFGNLKILCLFSLAPNGHCDYIIETCNMWLHAHLRRSNVLRAYWLMHMRRRLMTHDCVSDLCVIWDLNLTSYKKWIQNEEYKPCVLLSGECKNCLSG